MDVDGQLLDLLSDGSFHSGEALGAALGVSRAAVWRRLKKLKKAGLSIETVPGRGYRLAAAIQPLDVEKIVACLKVPMDVQVFRQVKSTNDLGLQRAKEALRSPVALLAEQQTAGRGRLGRQWQSPLGHNIYLTLVWPFEAGTDLKGMSLVVGLCLAQVLQDMGLPSAGLKWPNDVLVGQHKLAGVLIELAGNLELNPVAVIGIGINGWLGAHERQMIGQPATDWLSETGQPLARNQCVARLLNALAQALPRFSANGFAAFLQDWQQLDVCAGKPIELVRGEQRLFAVARGVDADGGLIIETERGIERVYGGEVSVRWA